MHICVFLSAANVAEKYVADAREFGRLIGGAGHTLVWGGSNTGLMKVVADAVEEAGGRLHGVSVDTFAAVVRPGADVMVMAANLGERKAQLLQAADAVVMLVGGSGTLDEFTDVLELKKQGKHSKPLVVVNTDGFYDGLAAQFRRMEAEGFLPVPLARLAFFANGARAAFAYLSGELEG